MLTIDTNLLSFRSVLADKINYEKHYGSLDIDTINTVALYKNDVCVLFAMSDLKCSDFIHIWSIYSKAMEAFSEAPIAQMYADVQTIAHVLAMLDTYGSFLYENASWSDGTR